MKLVTNLVLGLNRAVLAEGLVFAEATGFPREDALQVLLNSPAYSRTMDAKGPKMVHGRVHARGPPFAAHQGRSVDVCRSGTCAAFRYRCRPFIWSFSNRPKPLVSATSITARSFGSSKTRIFAGLRSGDRLVILVGRGEFASSLSAATLFRVSQHLCGTASLIGRQLHCVLRT